MLKIGLTGGIGCGKSTVAQFFADFHIPVLDADLIAHQLVAVGQPALLEIAQTFGGVILNSDGSLNRSLLKERVFSDLQQKQKLEAILHPLIYQAILAQIAQLSAPYCIICIPLLFETQMSHLVDRILVVDCPLSKQIERVQSRDQLSLARIESILATQVSREFRIAHADDLIDNSHADSALAEQVKKLHNFYLSVSDRQDKSVCEHQHHL
ncbi:MAG: dephospho-CoA kinase [Methylococcales bacterium]